jgi:catechol 2,3-dioxygenase-like lactoylglutathione lyase family enzyme
MAVNGIANIVYAVDDVAEVTRFLEDFGLSLVEKSGTFALFRLAEGSSASVRSVGDPAIAASGLSGPGAHEITWGVDTEQSFQRLVEDLQQDHALSVARDGSVHFCTDFGLAMGIKVFNKLPVETAPSPANSPGSVNRFNQWRKWRKRAQPKAIQHVGYACPDMNRALDFFRGRLKFRVSDMQKGATIYLRCEAANDHHNLVLIDADMPAAHAEGKLAYNHTNYLVEDIDEIMAGKMYMESRGWPPSRMGLGRHRIGSGAFLYLPAPTGGEIEYGADIDMIDDTWVPHSWDLLFGYLTFGHNIPATMLNDQKWEMTFIDPETVRHTPFKEVMAELARERG